MGSSGRKARELASSLATLIAGVSSSIACSDDDKAKLTTQADQLEEATKKVQAVLDDFNAAIADSTGSTEPQVSGNPATTKAMALRMDRLVRDVLAKMSNN